MNVSVFLLSLNLHLALSSYHSYNEDALSTSVNSSKALAGLAAQFQPQDTVRENIPNIHDRKRRTPEPEPQPQAEPTDSPSLSSNESYRIVCHYTNYAWYRSGIGKFSPRDTDPQLCTHIVYGFAVLDADRLVIKPSDKWADIENRHYEKVVALNKRGVKVLIALGGWNDSGGDKYSRLVNSPTSRRRFIEYLLHFIYEYGFDGLQLDWEYPKCWQLSCNKGPESDKDAFVALIRELREAFKPHGLLLTAVVPPTKQPIDAGFSAQALSENLDWITVKSYDYHGHWDKRTGHSAPLYTQPEDDDVTLSLNFTAQYWLSQGVDSRKLVLGVPMFGNSFKLNNIDNNGLYAYSSGPGEGGEQSTTPGILAYYEICDRVQKKGWEIVKDPKGAMGPYARRGDQWVAFDDPAMVQRKAEYIIQNNLGGIMIFSLSFDDFRNYCGNGKYPLLKSINMVLRKSPGPAPNNSSMSSEQQKPEIPTTERQTTDQQTTTTTTATAPGSSKLVCYFTNWSWYREGLGKFLPQNIDTSLCTHIVYAFASLDPKSLTVQSKDKWTDLDNDFYRQVTRLKQKGVKVLLGLGGWEDSKGDKYSRLANDPDARSRFVPHLSEFLRTYDFDGISLHWEYPVCWQSDCNAGPASDKQSFTALLTELSQELKPRGLLMSAIAPHNSYVIQKSFDVKTLVKHLDWLDLKAYDFHGAWDKRTGHGSPLYYAEGDISPILNVNFSVHYWLDAGVPKEKLVLGMPLYGQTFTLEDPSNVTLGSPVRGPGNPGPYTASAGTMAFHEICEMVHGEGWKVEKPVVGTVAYLDTQWVSYDDVEDVHRKTQFIKDLGLGGAMVWSLDFDDFNNNCGCGTYPLLKALNHGLRGSSSTTVTNCTAATVSPR